MFIQINQSIQLNLRNKDIFSFHCKSSRISNFHVSVCPLCQKRYKLLWYLYILLAKEQRPKKCEFVILCHDLTFHDFTKTTNTNYRTEKSLIKIQMSICQPVDQMCSFYCQDRLYQKFGGISQKSAKNTEQWFLCTYKLSLIFSYKNKVQITLEVKILAYSRYQYVYVNIP